ncbi:hypothetical protein AOLI_G00177970 [Acnodon oligacanthus]
MTAGAERRCPVGFSPRGSPPNPSAGAERAEPVSPPVGKQPLTFSDPAQSSLAFISPKPLHLCLSSKWTTGLGKLGQSITENPSAVFGLRSSRVVSRPLVLSSSGGVEEGELGWSHNCCDRWRKGQKCGNSWKNEGHINLRVSRVRACRGCRGRSELHESTGCLASSTSQPEEVLLF